MLKKQQKGFTLIELLVAVSLMLILIGAIVLIFSRSTQLFNLSEANMSVFQNARVAFDFMSKELAGSRGDLQIVAAVPQANDTTEQTLLTFSSVVSFSNPDNNGELETRLAEIQYRVVPLSGSNRVRWVLLRNFVIRDPENAANTLQDSTDVLCQFIAAPSSNEAPGISFELASFVDEAGTERWRVFNDQSQFNDAGGSADAVRVTMDVTDDQSRVTRTVSRVFWVANTN